MEKVCEELEEAKIEIEKLKMEFKVKAEQHGNLKRAYDELLNKLKKASLKAENQGEELSRRAEEISELKQICEETKSSLNEKDLIIKHLRAANDKLHADFDEKSQIREEENRSLILALEEATLKCANQEQKIKQLEEETRKFKGLLESSRRKCSEAEEAARAPKQLKDRDDIIVNLEEACRKVEDQLKWKKEQFKHLEEAHNKLRDRYGTDKKEWEKEKSSFLDEIFSLQTRLDSQTRISEDLEKRLQMCNQALAYEEGRRKSLEVQLADFKMRFEDVSAECEEAKSQLDGLMAKRDQEIGNLRHTLGKKEAFYKELEYRAGQLERENQELLISLKELQEAQIHGAGSSLAKLRNRLKNVEQIHRDCSSTLQAKEAEWSSKLKELTTDLDDSRSELVNKEIELEKTQRELEYCYSSLMQLMLLNEESFVMLSVLKAGIYEAQLKLAEDVVDRDANEQQRKGKASFEMEQLEIKSSNLAKANGDITEENKKLKLELQRHQKILEESSRCQVQLKEKAMQMEIDSEERIREVCDALDRTNAELTDRICEVNETEFELHIWKSTAERLRVEIEENQYQRKELEASLLAQVEVEDALKQERCNLIQMLEERDQRIDSLQQKINQVEENMQTIVSEAANSAKMESLVSFESDKNDFIRTLREKDVMFENLLKEIQGLEQETFRREFEGTLLAVIGAERNSQLEKEELMKLVEAKNRRINDLLQFLSSLEQKFNSLSESFPLQLAEKQAEINLFSEAWDKLTAAEILAELEIEEKKMMIMELENEVGDLINKLESQGESLSCFKQRSSEVEAVLEAKELEMKQLTYQMEKKLKSSDTLIEELKNEKGDLMKERDNLMALVNGLDERIHDCCNEDTLLMERIMQLQSNSNCSNEDLTVTEVFEPVKENANVHHLPLGKPFEAVFHGRSPFRELNN